MNQQQKKFAITRLHEILSLKAAAIVIESESLNEEHRNIGRLTTKDIAKGISDGTIKMLPVSKLDDTEDVSRGLNLDRVFNLPSSKIAREAFAKKHGVDTYYSGGLTPNTIALKDPLTTKGTNYFQVYGKSHSARIRAMQAALNKAADAIVFASDEEAMKAISDMEAMSF